MNKRITKSNEKGLGAEPPFKINIEEALNIMMSLILSNKNPVENLRRGDYVSLSMMHLLNCDEGVKRARETVNQMSKYAEVLKIDPDTIINWSSWVSVHMKTFIELEIAARNT